MPESSGCKWINGWFHLPVRIWSADRKKTLSVRFAGIGKRENKLFDFDCSFYDTIVQLINMQTVFNHCNVDSFYVQ